MSRPFLLNLPFHCNSLALWNLFPFSLLDWLCLSPVVSGRFESICVNGFLTFTHQIFWWVGLVITLCIGQVKQQNEEHNWLLITSYKRRETSPTLDELKRSSEWGPARASNALIWASNSETDLYRNATLYNRMKWDCLANGCDLDSRPRAGSKI